MKASDVIQRLGFWIVVVSMFLLPLFFLPITSEFYEFNKNFLLIVASAILLLLLAAGYVSERQVKILRSPFGLPLLAILVTWLLSTLLRSPNRVDALIDPAQTGTILALVVFFVSAINFIRTRQEAEIAALTIASSLGLLGFLSVVWGSELTLNISLLPTFMKNALWTPTGSALTTIVALIAGLPFVVTLLARERKLNLRSSILAACMVLQIAGAAFFGYRLLLPENKPLFLSQQSAWAIALDALKISPLVGTGPSTYLSDFTRFRPLSYNMTPNWSFRFTTSSNYYLQILATVGFLGLVAYLFLVVRTYLVLVQSAKAVHNPEAAGTRVIALAATSSAAFLLVSQLFIPVSVVALGLLIIFLVLTTAGLKLAGSTLVSEAHVDIVAAGTSDHKSPLLPWIFLALAILLAVPSLYLAARAYLAETQFQTALLAAASNDGKKTYDTLLLAMATNPQRDSYRVVYSQTNLLLANSIAGKKDLSESDRATVTQLIQQSIQEAKNAVALNPLKVTNVENLATIYRNLLNLAQGADTWTVASYRQAISLDPVNPNLRVALGGVLYSLKNYDEAINLFRQGADLKPDLANAHYNLAASYREKGDFQNAFNSMQKVIQLVDKSSTDYTKASEELAQLADQLGSKTNPQAVDSQPGTLTTPAPLPSPIVSPKIELSADLAPESPASPSSSP